MQICGICKRATFTIICDPLNANPININHLVVLSMENNICPACMYFIDGESREHRVLSGWCVLRSYILKSLAANAVTLSEREYVRRLHAEIVLQILISALARALFASFERRERANASLTSDLANSAPAPNRSRRTHFCAYTMLSW
jgi:hypothetical protein